ncbi:uncharacterized protein TRAVEDRAFT_53909 [Trametes versicolor FP-101664 SS1]|uniref:Fungal N-terminal domain-containing protein n=1 Tax=Trametes versicolor (strain FP-101664) TaxID=717944 RepID=R7SAC0_TRAVS|nr:uncharacterized protein TRAVEDRAFT_53909 [Trametes versicolor FP-101664 SS1]EIW51914.1 hypothetical protein TRAVEDRAFT_53909 [Trametes versicolor FP-101664 SS1]
MPDSLDITGFVISIISLVGLHKLGALAASRLPPGRLKAIKADLTEMRELLEHLECERYPSGAATLHQFQSSLQQLNTRAGNLSLETSRWKERGVLRRYAHWAECGELIHDCRDLQGDIADLRAHLHKLPPRARHAWHALQVMPSEAGSSYTAAGSPNPTIATSVSSASASSTVASSSPSLPETPSSSVSDAAPTPVKSGDTTEPAESPEPAPAPDNWGRRMRRRSISSESTESTEPLESTEPAPAHDGSHWMKRTARTTIHTPPEEYIPERRRALVPGRSDVPILRNRAAKTADHEPE